MPKIEIKVSKDKDYKIYPITGVWGGITPTGLIAAEFFYDKAKIPDEMIVNVDENTGIGSEELGKSAIFQRNVLFSTSMTPSDAKSIGTWLLKKVEEFEKLNQGNK